MYVHYPELKEGAFVDTEKRPIEIGKKPGFHTYVSFASAQINHYFCKSREEWEQKRAKGRADRLAGGGMQIRDEEAFSELDANDLEDKTIWKHLGATTGEIEKLKAVVEKHQQESRVEKNNQSA